MFFFTLFGLFLCVNHIYSQDSTEIHAEIYVNGSNTATSLSKSQQNFLTIKGTGFDTFELQIVSGCATKTEKQGGYIVQPTCGTFITFSIIGRTGNNTAVLCNRGYKIVD
jgi:hypothetical protein